MERRLHEKTAAILNNASIGRHSFRHHLAEIIGGVTGGYLLLRKYRLRLRFSLNMEFVSAIFSLVLPGEMGIRTIVPFRGMN